jgi:hypothetical protein
MAAFKVRLEDGSEMGPLDMEMLRSWYQQGLVTRGSKVRRTNGKQWVPLTDAVDISAWARGRHEGARGRAEEELESMERPAAGDLLASVPSSQAAGATLHGSRALDPALKEAPWRETRSARL